MPLLFIQRGLPAIARQILREIVAADESGRVEDGSANHDSDSCHCGYIYSLLHIGSRACVRVRSHIGREYLLVLQILLQGDAASHNDCELDVVHQVGAGVASKVFFNDFLTNPANTSDKAGDGCSVKDRLHELVVRHVVCGIPRVLVFIG